MGWLLLNSVLAYPFLISARVSETPAALPKLPTAVHAWAVRQDTPARTAPVFPGGLALGSSAQAVPFHDSASVSDVPEPL
jgi:hypothetical protein